MRYRTVVFSLIMIAACNPDKADPGAEESSSTVMSGSEDAPFDEANPPVLTGTISIKGGGWDVSGEFTLTVGADGATEVLLS